MATHNSNQGRAGTREPHTRTVFGAHVCAHTSACTLHACRLRKKVSNMARVRPAAAGDACGGHDDDAIFSRCATTRRSIQQGVCLHVQRCDVDGVRGALLQCMHCSKNTCAVGTHAPAPAMTMMFLASAIFFATPSRSNDSNAGGGGGAASAPPSSPPNSASRSMVKSSMPIGGAGMGLLLEVASCTTCGALLCCLLMLL
jgi:hypothetical protein